MLVSGRPWTLGSERLGSVVCSQQYGLRPATLLLLCKEKPILPMRAKSEKVWVLLEQQLVSRGSAVKVSGFLHGCTFTFTGG